MDKGNSVGSAGSSAFPHGDDAPRMLARAEVDAVSHGLPKTVVLFPIEAVKRKMKKSRPGAARPERD